MAVSIKEHFKFAGTQQEVEFKRFAMAVLTDLTALRDAVTGTQGALDSNGGAGTNYVANHTPPTLTLTE